MAPQNNQSSPQNTRDALRERLRSLIYEVDHTAENPANKVVEVRTLTAANRSDFNHIVPKAAPFYAHTVKITHTQTNQVLVNGQDFYCVGTFAKAVANVLNHRQVNWAIIFDDPNISGEYKIEYQTVGGEFVLDNQELTEVLANYLENPRSGDWEQVVGKPLMFPPLPHNLHVNDLYGMEEQVKATREVKDAILALLRDEEQDHPGYGQVITELFRQQRRQDKFQQDLDNIRIQNSQSNASLGAQLSDEIKRVEKESKARDTNAISELTQLINSNIATIDSAYKAEDAKLNRLITTTKEAIETTMGEKETNLRKLINKIDADQTNARSTAIAGLNATIESVSSELRQGYTKADQVINRSIESLKTDLTGKIKTVETNLGTVIANRVSELASSTTERFTAAKTDRDNIRNLIATNKGISDAAENALSERITTEVTARTRQGDGLGQRLTAIEGRINGNDEFVKRWNIDQYVEGTKTFVNGIQFLNRDNNSKVNRLTSNSKDVYLYNATSDSYLQLYNSGELMYNGQKVLLQPDLEEIKRRFGVIEGRANNHDEFVKRGNIDQVIDGNKVFMNGIKFQNNADRSKVNVMGSNGRDVFIYNATANSYLQMFNNGELRYNEQKVLLQPDFEELVRRLANYIPLNDNATVKGRKIFTERVDAPLFKSSPYGGENEVAQEQTEAPFLVEWINHRGTARFEPFIKGKVQTTEGEWPCIMAFGSSGFNGTNNYACPAILFKPLTHDNRGLKTWYFKQNGDFYSAGNVVTASGNALDNTVNLTSDQNVNGTKSFKHWLRIRHVDSDNSYLEFSHENDRLLRCWAGGEDRFYINAGGRFIALNQFTIGGKWGNTQRFCNLSVNVNDNDPYLNLHGDDGFPLYGRLSVHDLYVRSDSRLKHDIERIENATDKLEAINGYTYFLNGSKSKSGGVIAQEVKEVLPEIVHELADTDGGEKHLSVQYHGIIALLVEALKESNARIRALEEKLNV